MKKVTKILVGALASTLIMGGIASCNKGSTPTPTPEPVVTTYKVQVSCPTGVTATSSHDRAEKGQEVTITITSIAAGFSIKKVTLNTNTELTASETNVYKFTMPNQSALIKISVDVTGEVTINGDFAAAFTKNEDTGIYEAKNVLVKNGSSQDADFGIKVAGETLGVLDLNTYKSFGDITMSNKNETPWTIATNCYYDFFYDPAFADESPVYIQRVGVDVLPTTVAQLGSLMITNWGPGAEYCNNTNDLLTANYSVKNVDGSKATDYINQVYNWKRYADNKVFATVNDQDQMGEETMMYVYKDLDVENDSYTVVDTYAKKSGTLVANDDPNREDYYDYGAYSAKYAIIEGDDYDYKRYSRNFDHAYNSLTTASHMPNHYLEREIMYAYRVACTVEDECIYSDVKIASTRLEGNAFKVQIDTTLEFDASASSYTSEIHQAHVYDVDIVFDARGAVTKLDFVKRMYQIASSSTEDEWDKTTHTPKTGKKGTVKKKINAEWTYGEATEELTSQILEEAEFNPSDYFLQEVSEIQFYNPATLQDKTTGKSYVHLGDDIGLLNTSCEFDKYVEKITFAPSTAIDLWQYGVTTSSDETIIAKEANDQYPYVSAVGEGKATVTFSNHHAAGTGAAGIEFNVEINVKCNTKIKEFYMSPVDDPYNYITKATPVTVRANTTQSYTLVSTPTPYAPMKYTATSSNNAVAEVTSAANSKIMTIKFGDVSKKTKVTITMNADYDQYYSATEFTFYVVTNDVDPVGTWGLVDYEDEARITFTNEYVAGSTTWKTGSIEDTNGSAHISATFKYSFDGLKVECIVTSISITGTSETWSTDPLDYELYAQYDAASGYYGIGLAEVVYEEYYESFVYSYIYGEGTDEGFTSYDPFTKVSN